MWPTNLGLLSRLRKSQFGASVATLMTGTGIAQAVPLLVAPLMSRLFTPADMGSYALFASIAGVLATALTGRYDLAIMLPADRREALHVAGASVAVSTIMSLLLLAVIGVSGAELSTALGAQQIDAFLVFVPLNTWLTGLYWSLNFWNNRSASFKRLALTRVIAAIAAAAVTISCGFLKMGAGGLVFGALAGQAVAVAALGFQVVFAESGARAPIKVQQLVAALIRYKRFPLYAMPSDLINSAANQIPVFVINNYFGIQAAGYYSLSLRVIGLPMQVIADSIGEVFRQRASVDFSRQGDCRHVFVKTFWATAALALPPCLALGMAGPFLFAVVFGQKWIASGVYAQVLAVMFFMRFLARPLSFVLYIAEKQRTNLFGNVLIAFAGLGLWLAAIALNSVALCLAFYSAIYTLAYIYFIAASYGAAANSNYGLRATSI